MFGSLVVGAGGAKDLVSNIDAVRLDRSNVLFALHNGQGGHLKTALPVFRAVGEKATVQLEK